MLDGMRDTGWFKSSYSSGDSDNCVEVRIIRCGIGARDSKNIDGPNLWMTGAAWIGFLQYIRAEND